MVIKCVHSIQPLIVNDAFFNIYLVDVNVYYGIIRCVFSECYLLYMIHFVLFTLHYFHFFKTSRCNKTNKSSIGQWSEKFYT